MRFQSLLRSRWTRPAYTVLRKSKPQRSSIRAIRSKVSIGEAQHTGDPLPPCSPATSRYRPTTDHRKKLGLSNFIRAAPRARNVRDIRPWVPEIRLLQRRVVRVARGGDLREAATLAVSPLEHQHPSAINTPASFPDRAAHQLIGWCRFQRIRPPAISPLTASSS